MSPADGALGAPSHLHLNIGAGTDRGLRRELNEDSFSAADPLFVVADGMGGHVAGEVASYECIQTLTHEPTLQPGLRSAKALDLHNALTRADARIREQTNARAGTTVTGAVLVEEHGLPHWLIFNVGDSRTYRLNRGSLEQITVDHSAVQEMLDGGYLTPAEALIHPRRHVVTRAIGLGPDAEADFWLIPVDDGDRILVCSDGLTGELSDHHILETLTSVADPQEAVDSLIQASLRSGGRDNITIVLVDAHLSETPGEESSTKDPATAQLSDTTALPTAEQAPAVTHLHEENHG